MSSPARIATAACALVLGCVGLAAWDWPGEDLTIAAGFGQSEQGADYATSMLLAGARQPIRAAHDGELVLHFDERAGIDSIPHGLGSFVVIEHERQFRMFYGHLAGPLPTLEQPTVAAGTVLGTLGASGYATGPGLVLQVSDRRREAFVNPQVLLPQLPDTMPPRIEGVTMSVRGTRTDLIYNEIVSVPSGEATVLTTVYDRQYDRPGARRIPAFRFSLRVDGTARELTLDTITHDGQRLVLGRNTPHDRLYEASWTYRLAEVNLTPGEHELVLVAEDYGGNRTTYRAVFAVTE